MGSNPQRPEPGYSSLARDVYSSSLDELFEAGEAVRQLMAHPGWVHVSRLLGAAVADLDASLDGRLKESRSEYAFAHGRRGGLRAMDEAARAIVGYADRRLSEQQTKHERGAAESVPVGG